MNISMAIITIKKMIPIMAIMITMIIIILYIALVDYNKDWCFSVKEWYLDVVLKFKIFLKNKWHPVYFHDDLLYLNFEEISLEEKPHKKVKPFSTVNILSCRLSSFSSDLFYPFLQMIGNIFLLHNAFQLLKTFSWHHLFL